MVGILAQVFLAGAGLFGLTDWGAHTELGWGLGTAGLLVLVLGAPLGREAEKTMFAQELSTQIEFGSRTFWALLPVVVLVLAIVVYALGTVAAWLVWTFVRERGDRTLLRRRLLPALLAMLITTVIAGHYLLDSGDLSLLRGDGLAALGLFTAFYGVAVGVTQPHPKTVLAYSSISQMGVIATVLGMGLAVARPDQQTSVRGGIPLVADGHVIGAIGVSAGSQDEDADVARAGAAALAGS